MVIKRNLTERHIPEHQGIMSIHRTQSTGSVLFGSPIKHDSYIAIRVDSCEVDNNTVDAIPRYYPRNRKIEVHLTSSQFAELITTLNVGNGTPCTIYWCEGKRNEIPQELGDDTQRFRNKVREINAEITAQIQVLVDMVNTDGVKLTKTQKKQLNVKLQSIISKLNHDYPFVFECFQERMESVKQQIKAELFADAEALNKRLQSEEGKLRPSLPYTNNFPEDI